MAATPTAPHRFAALRPERNPRAARAVVLGVWAALSVLSVGLAGARQGSGLRASYTRHVEPGNPPVFSLQNDGRKGWPRVRLVIDGRFVAEHVDVEAGLAWRFGPADLLDLQQAPLALIDAPGAPYYATLAGPEAGATGGRRAPATLAPKHLRIEVGPDVLELETKPTDATP